MNPEHYDLSKVPPVQIGPKIEAPVPVGKAVTLEQVRMGRMSKLKPDKKHKFHKLSKKEQAEHPGYTHFEEYPKSDTTIEGKYWHEDDLPEDLR